MRHSKPVTKSDHRKPHGVSRHKSQKMFTNTATKKHASNDSAAHVMRGSIRL